MRSIYGLSVVVFVCLVGVALAGGSPDPAVSGGSCQGKVAAAPKATCQGEAKEEAGCHGSSKKATRRTMAQRRADRQTSRQEARADRAEARTAAKGCHGTAKAAPVAAACDCNCGCGDSAGCEDCSADCASRQ